MLFVSLWVVISETIGLTDFNNSFIDRKLNFFPITKAMLLDVNLLMRINPRSTALI